MQTGYLSLYIVCYLFPGCTIASQFDRSSKHCFFLFSYCSPCGPWVYCYSWHWQLQFFGSMCMHCCLSLEIWSNSKITILMLRRSLGCTSHVMLTVSQWDRTSEVVNFNFVSHTSRSCMKQIILLYLHNSASLAQFHPKKWTEPE